MDPKPPQPETPRTINQADANVTEDVDIEPDEDEAWKKDQYERQRG